MYTGADVLLRKAVGRYICIFLLGGGEWTDLRLRRAAAHSRGPEQADPVSGAALV